MNISNVNLVNFSFEVIAKKIYQGESIVYRSSKSRIMKEMGEFVSQLFRLPIIDDATVNRMFTVLVKRIDFSSS